MDFCKCGIETNALVLLSKVKMPHEMTCNVLWICRSKSKYKVYIFGPLFANNAATEIVNSEYTLDCFAIKIA